MNDFTLNGYTTLIKDFLSAGYSFEKFSDIASINKTSPKVILRHDVDFSMEAAKKIALVNAELGVQATFFFQLRSPLYNLLCTHSLELLSVIRSLGHDIALHAELTADNSDLLLRLKIDLQLFQQVFPEVNSSIVSFHRIGDRFALLNGIEAAGIKHTYSKEFLEDMAYCSDSKGRWTSGHPLDSVHFRNAKDIQLLVHPEWWLFGGTEVPEKLRNLVSEQRRCFILHMQEHVCSFDILQHFEDDTND